MVAKDLLRQKDEIVIHPLINIGYVIRNNDKTKLQTRYQNSHLLDEHVHFSVGLLHQ